MNFSKRIIAILTTLLVASCTNLRASYNRSMDAFEFSQDCPIGCFMGIKPLVTTPKDALHILENSPDIDQSTLSILYNNGNGLAENINDSSLELMKDGSTLQARWAPTNNKNFGFYLHIGATDDVVDHVSVRPISKTMQDFIAVIGQPDKIQVDGMQPPDAPYFINYSVFYDKWKLLIYVLITDIEGPNPDDEIYYVTLNQDIDQADFKLWQGYGKMRSYMTTELLNDYQSFTQDYATAKP